MNKEELAALVAELFDQLPGFLVGNEPGGLHRIHQQLQFCQFEIPLTDKPAARLSLPALDVHSHIPQLVHVRVNTLALGGNTKF